MSPTLSSLLISRLVWLNAADRQQAVESGRGALDRPVWDYPWYDGSTDGVRPIDVAEPWWYKWADLFDFNWPSFNLFGSLGSFSWLDWVVWTVLIVALGLLIWLLVRVFFKGEQAVAKAGTNHAKSNAAGSRRRIEALPLPARRNRSDLLGEAERYYRSGNYAEAIIYLFSHELVRLDKSQLIHLTKGKTNRQYSGELGRRMPLRRMLEQTMVTFEDAFFGNHPITRARFESCWVHLDEFESLLTEEIA